MAQGYLGGGSYSGGAKRAQDAAPPPAAYTSAVEFRNGFDEGSLERRLLGFEKSWRHGDSWKHMPYQLRNEDYPTVGYGHYMDDSSERALYGFDSKTLKKRKSTGGRREYENMEIPESKAQEWFKRDVSQSKTDTIKVASDMGVDWNTIPEESQQALTEMVYQMGATRVRGFPSMWEGYRKGDLGMVQREMLDSDWNKKQTGARAVSVTALLDGIEDVDFPAQTSKEAAAQSKLWSAKYPVKSARLSAARLKAAGTP